MHQARSALGLIAPPDPLGLAIAQAQQVRRLHQRQLLAFDPDHNRHPIPFLPVHGQCLHVMAGLLPQPRPKGDISIELRWGHSHGVPTRDQKPLQKRWGLRYSLGVLWVRECRRQPGAAALDPVETRDVD